MFKNFAAYLLVGFAFFMSAVNISAATFFTANMTGTQETPSNASTATGFGRVTLNDAETQITASFYYGNPTVLSSNVTAGHIHTGAFGVAGPVTFNLAPATGVTSGSVVNATFAVTAQQVTDLKAGNMYFNIHTTNFGGGEIRGQIRVDAPYLANMTNGQENPATTATGAKGFGAVSVNEATNQALVSMNWSGLSGTTTASHYHNGRSGTNGPVICNFALSGAATTGSLVDFLCTFTPAQITALKQGQLYLNIHTAANPGGEIRGQIQRRRSTVLDFDGDGKTDFVNTRTNTPNLTTDWWVGLSSGGFSAFSFGLDTDNVRPRTVGCDFDGDGKDDPAIWRTGASPAAAFYILQSSNGTVRTEQFGTTGDNPSVVYDYDGDGRCDPAVYRSGNGTWYFLGSSNNSVRNITYAVFGSGSFPNPGDYDGDGRGDFMVQGSGGSWWTLNSSDLSVKITQFGTASFFGNPGDYDGDGKTDVAGSVTEGTNKAWYYSSSLSPTQDIYRTRVAWGDTTSRRAQGDYDGDGKTDVGVFSTSTTITPTPSYWALLSGNGQALIYTWGISADVSVNNYNNR
jgi:CHRD domain